MDKQQLYQLSAMLASVAEGMYRPDSGGAAMARSLKGSAQSAIQAEAVKKAKEEEEKKKKGGMFGSIGSALGTIGGVALAPFTGGTSLAATAAMGALGSTVGGTAGTLLGGGDVTARGMLTDAVMGGVGGAASWAMPNLMPGLKASPVTQVNGMPVGATSPISTPTLSAPPQSVAGIQVPSSLGDIGGSVSKFAAPSIAQPLPVTAKQLAMQNLGGYMMASPIIGGMRGGIDPLFNPQQRTTVEMRRRYDGSFEPYSPQSSWGF